MTRPLENTTILVTGITDSSSLALAIAKQLQKDGAKLICSGLGLTQYHTQISDKAKAYLERTYADFQATIQKELGSVPTYPLDVTIDESIQEFSDKLAKDEVKLDGYIHSIAMDKTIRGGVVKPMLEVTKEEFADAMHVSAYSLLAITRPLLLSGILKKGSSIAALSYLGAEKIVVHPYKNIGVAKAALERLVFELSYELGKSHAIRVNAVRFSPYTASKAGGAIEGLSDAVQYCENAAPLGNARPSDLAEEVSYLMKPGLRITGEVRHVDGGYHIRG